MRTAASRQQLWLLLGAIAVVAGATLILFLFDPTQYRFFPGCPFHEATGWSCPGCGGLRAVHQLTHGNIAAAWRLNPLLLLLMPVAFWLGARELAWQLFGKAWPGLVTRPIFGWALAVVVVLFGIVRNVPGLHL